MLIHHFHQPTSAAFINIAQENIFVARAHCWVLCNSLPSPAPRSFLQICSSGSPQPASLQWLLPSQVQKFAFILVAFQKFPVNLIHPTCLGISGWQPCSQSLIRLVSPTCCHVQTCWECTYLMMLNRTHPKRRGPLEYLTWYRHLGEVKLIIYGPLILIIQLFLYPSSCPLVQSIYLNLDSQILWDIVKDLTKIKVNGIHYSPLIHKSILL